MVPELEQATLLEKNKIPKFSSSWAMMTYSRKYPRKGTTLYQSCLEVYYCPVEGCKYIARPAYPPCKVGEKRRKGRPPDKPLGSDKCSVHNKPLEHIPCQATCVLVRNKNATTTVSHKGYHSHPRPHEKKPSNASIAAMKERRKLRPDSTPRQMVMGDEIVDGTRTLHPALGNSDRVGYFMKLIMDKFKKFSLDDIPNWEKEGKATAFGRMILMRRKNLMVC